MNLSLGQTFAKNKGFVKRFLAITISSYCIHGTASALTVLSEEEYELGDFYGDEDFVEIATGTSQSLDKAPAIASVISAKQIKDMGATHLDEILERVPGLHVSTSTLSRLDPVYSIRGIQTGFNPQVLVLVNGTEFKNSFSGGLPYTFRLPASNIERVEIIRGPGSALYGADAYSGVINVVLKKHGEAENITVGGRVGSFDSRDYWFQAGKTFGDLAVGLSVENQQSDGDDERIAQSDLQSVFDGIFATSASLAPGQLQSQYDVTDIHLSLAYKGWTFENWWWKQDKGGIGPGGAQALDNVGFQDVDQYRARVTYDADLSPELSLSGEASLLETDTNSYFVLFPAGAVLPIGSDGNTNFTDVAGLVQFPDGYIGNPRSDQKDTRVKMSLNYSGLSKHQIRATVGWFEQQHTAQEFKNFGPGVIDGSQGVVTGELTDVTGTPYIFLPDAKRFNRHLVLQDIWNFAPDWELTLGMRYDDFSDFGSTTNPRLALVWEAAHNVTVKALYGSAFRAPSFNDQFLQNNPSAFGNPDLKPETIDTYELGIVYQLDFNNKLAANIYSFRADDLIARGPVPNSSLLQTLNLSSQDGQGIEFEYNYKGESFALSANFTYQSLEDHATNQQVPLVTRRSAFVGWIMM